VSDRGGGALVNAGPDEAAAGLYESGGLPDGLKEANEQWALLNGATSHQPKLRFRQFD